MAEPALSRLRVTQALPLSYRMLGGGSPQLSRREAGSRTDLCCQRPQAETAPGRSLNLILGQFAGSIPSARGSCGQHRQNLFLLVS